MATLAGRRLVNYQLLHPTLNSYVNHQVDDDPDTMVNTLAHEIGHNFGADHDGADSIQYRWSNCENICTNPSSGLARAKMWGSWLGVPSRETSPPAPCLPCMQNSRLFCDNFPHSNLLKSSESAGGWDGWRDLLWNNCIVKWPKSEFSFFVGGDSSTWASCSP